MIPTLKKSQDGMGNIIQNRKNVIEMMEEKIIFIGGNGKKRT